jgi:hypothetical protein
MPALARRHGDCLTQTGDCPKRSLHAPSYHAVRVIPPTLVGGVLT